MLDQSLARRIRSGFKDEAGVAAVEFAVVFPTFILLLLGFFSVGHTFYIAATLNQAVSDAARYARMSPAPSDEAISQLVTARVAEITEDIPVVQMTSKVAVTGGMKRTLSANLEIDYSFPFFDGSLITLTSEAELFTRS